MFERDIVDEEARVLDYAASVFDIGRCSFPIVVDDLVAKFLRSHCGYLENVVHLEKQ